jgi:hypothetical protein
LSSLQRLLWRVLRQVEALTLWPWRVPGERIEQGPRLRGEEVPAATTLVVRGGRDTPGKLRSHAQRTASAWSLDRQPLLGISVFAVLDMLLDDLLRRRFATFRTIYLPAAGRLAGHRFELLATGQRPHFTAGASVSGLVTCAPSLPG